MITAPRTPFILKALHTVAVELLAVPLRIDHALWYRWWAHEKAAGKGDLPVPWWLKALRLWGLTTYFARPAKRSMDASLDSYWGVTPKASGGQVWRT